MSKYLVITDSTADFTPEQIEQLGIEVIPMEFLMEDKTYLNYPDGREMTNEQFYAAMRNGQRLLAGDYQTDTPAAIVYKATWDDEKVCRCTVATLAQTAKEHNITKTALIIVGNCLGNEYDRSLLYHPSFTHEFRKGTSES